MEFCQQLLLFCLKGFANKQWIRSTECLAIEINDKMYNERQKAMEQEEESKI